MIKVTGDHMHGTPGIQCLQCHAVQHECCCGWLQARANICMLQPAAKNPAHGLVSVIRRGVTALTTHCGARIFQYHMTLTNRVMDSQKNAICSEQLYGVLCPAVWLHSVQEAWF